MSMSAEGPNAGSKADSVGSKIRIAPSDALTGHRHDGRRFDSNCIVCKQDRRRASLQIKCPGRRDKMPGSKAEGAFGRLA